MKRSRALAYSVGTALLMLAASPPARASFHTPPHLFTNLASLDSGDCSGSQCTFTATWATGWHGSQEHGFYAFTCDDNADIGCIDLANDALQMTTLLVASGIIGTGGNRPPLASGDSFTVPIDASGEVMGMSASFYDTPPITFLPNGIVHVERGGLNTCQLHALVDNPNDWSCDDAVAHADSEDILGTWQDAWQAFTDPDGDGTFDTPTTDISCATGLGGGSALCSSRATFSGGRVKLVLRRTVDNFVWENLNTPVVAIGYPALGIQNPFPGAMEAVAFVDFHHIPKGFHNSPSGIDDCEVSTGWACDLDDPNQPLSVDIYDGPAGSLPRVGRVRANLLAGQTAAAECGGNEQHGFSFLIPPSLKDGLAHRLHAYALNIAPPGQPNPLLTASPRTITCTSSGPPQPDFIAENATVAGPFTSGQPHTLSGQVRNQGNAAPSGPSSTGFSLNHMSVGIQDTQALGPGGTETELLTWTPPVTGGGSFTLIMCADLFNNVIESNETNNCSDPFTFSVGMDPTVTPTPTPTPLFPTAPILEAPP